MRGINIYEQDDLICVSGNTFPIKEVLSSNGARWNPDVKVWYFKSKTLEEIEMVLKDIDNKSQSFTEREYDVSFQKKTTEMKIALEESPDREEITIETNQTEVVCKNDLLREDFHNSVSDPQQKDFRSTSQTNMGVKLSIDFWLGLDIESKKLIDFVLEFWRSYTLKKNLKHSNVFKAHLMVLYQRDGLEIEKRIVSFRDDRLTRFAEKIVRYINKKKTMLKSHLKVYKR